MKSRKGIWVKNIPKGGLQTQYPRRLAKYIVGEPMWSPFYTKEEMVAMNLEGMYLDEDVPEGLNNRPMVTYGDKPIEE